MGQAVSEPDARLLPHESGRRRHEVLMPVAYLTGMPGCAESHSWRGRVLQVLVDEEPGLLGSIVDVEITGSSRWCTFGDIREWVYRCPPPPQQAAPAAAAGVLRARARVAAARAAAKATSQQPPPRAGAGAGRGHEGAGVASQSRHSGAGPAAAAGEDPLRPDGAAGGGGPDGRASWGACCGAWEAWGAVQSRVGRLIGWPGAHRGLHAGEEEEAASCKGHRERAGMGREDALLIGGAAVGLCGLALAGLLILQQRRSGGV